MTLPKIYIIDDNNSSILRVTKILLNKDDFYNARDEFIKKLTDVNKIAKLNSINFDELPTREIVHIDNSTDEKFNKCLCSFRQLFAQDKSPSILYLDYALRSFSESDNDAVDAAETLKAYKPSKQRTWALASIWGKGASAPELSGYQQYRGQESVGALSENGCPVIFHGLLHWLIENETTSKSLYDSFIDELLDRGHDKTIDASEVCTWLTKYYPQISSYSGELDDPKSIKRRIVDDCIHMLATPEYYVNLDGAYILAAIALHSSLQSKKLVDQTAEALFSEGLIANYYEMTSKSCFIAGQDYNSRKLTLRLLGEAFSRLLICEDKGCCKSENRSKISSIKNVELKNNYFAVTLCFPPFAIKPKEKGLAVELQHWARGATEWLRSDLAGRVIITPTLTPDTGHTTSGLLYALRSALTLATEKYIDSGSNYLGSDVIVRLVKHEECTKIEFKG